MFHLGNDTLVKDICESAQRNCNTTLNPRIVKYKGIRKIVSPTKNLSIDAATIETLVNLNNFLEHLIIITIY